MRAGFALRFQVVGELASQSCPRLRACDLSTAKCPWPTLVMCGISGFFPGRPVTQRLSGSALVSFRWRLRCWAEQCCIFLSTCLPWWVVLFFKMSIPTNGMAFCSPMNIFKGGVCSITASQVQEEAKGFHLPHQP